MRQDFKKMKASLKGKCIALEQNKYSKCIFIKAARVFSKMLYKQEQSLPDTQLKDFMYLCLQDK